MSHWLCAALAALSLLFVSLWLPVVLSCNLQGKAEPSGAWALACGLALGPIALSAIGASGVPPFLTCHLFGKQRLRVTLSRLFGRRVGAASEPSLETPEGALPARSSRLSRAARSILGALDPLQVLLELWGNERVFRVRSLVLTARYSFRDVALTGRILASLYALSGVLPEHCEIHQTPSWNSEDRVALEIDGQFRVWPLRLLYDLARSVVMQWIKGRLRAPATPRSTPPT